MSDRETDYLRSLPGNAEAYDLCHTPRLENSPLKGWHAAFLGSSVTLGAASLHVSFADYLSERHGMTYVKEAVNGTTLVDNGPSSYIQRMLNLISADEKFDFFVCQLSTNDAGQGKPLGEISPGFDEKEFDTSTITGAMEFIIAYVRRVWGCPVLFYTGSRFDNAAYAAMVENLLRLRDKWGIGVMDLWNDDAFNNIPKDHYALYMNDPIHPTRAGYRDWWMPQMEKTLLDYLGGK